MLFVSGVFKSRECIPEAGDMPVWHSKVLSRAVPRKQLGD